METLIWADEIANAVKLLQDGSVILYPTDTIWGLGCAMDSEEAVERIFRIKQRPRTSPLILLVSSFAMLRKYVNYIHPRLENLLEVHSQPLTVIYDKTKNIPHYLLNDQKSIAIRIVQDPYTQELIEVLGLPITSTSANITGHPFPKYFGEVSSEIIQQVDFISTYMRESREERQPSVIVRCDENGELDFLRM